MQSNEPVKYHLMDSTTHLVHFAHIARKHQNLLESNCLVNLPTKYAFKPLSNQPNENKTIKAYTVNAKKITKYDNKTVKYLKLNHKDIRCLKNRHLLPSRHQFLTPKQAKIFNQMNTYIRIVTIV